MERKLLIWDFDGTLAYRRGSWSGALIDVLDRREHGHSFSADQVRPHLRQGFPWHDSEEPHPDLCEPDAWWDHVNPVFARAYSALGIGQHRASDLARHVRGCYCDPTRWFAFADVPDTLTQLQRDGWTHAVLSNHVPELEDIVAALGLGSFFEAVYSSALTGFEKPSARAFLHVVEQLGAPDRVWMIGDNPVADIAGAAAVGIRGVLIRGGAEERANPSTDLSGVRGVVNEDAGSSPSS